LRTFANGGSICVSGGFTIKDNVRIHEGMILPFGYASPYLVNDYNRMATELGLCRVLVYGMQLSSFGILEEGIRICLSRRVWFFVFAAGIDDSVISCIVVNRIRKGLRLAMALSRGFGISLETKIQDLCSITGARVLAGVFQFGRVHSYLGILSRALVFGETCNITGDSTMLSLSLRRVRFIRGTLNNSFGTYSRSNLEESLARLIGGLAIIRIRSSMKVCSQDRILRLEDSLCSSRSTFEEGSVPGGGRTNIDLARLLRNSVTVGALSSLGIDIFSTSIIYSFRLIASNVGALGTVVCEKLVTSSCCTSGFDGRRNRVVDMEALGLLDSCKSLRVVLDTSSCYSRSLFVSDWIVS